MATRKPVKSLPPRNPPGESARQGRILTSDRISDDLAAFEDAGGRIEVLGTTRVLRGVAELEASKARAKEGGST